jgi:hypothetical protein
MRVEKGRLVRLDRKRLHTRRKKKREIHPQCRPPQPWQPDLDGRKKLDLQGIEPWTTPMLREYYTTKPQARFCSCEETTYTSNIFREN